MKAVAGLVGLGDTGEGLPVAALGEPAQQLPIRKTDGLIISLEDESFVGGAKPIDARSHLTNGWDVDLPTDGGVLDVGAVNRQARSGIPC